MEGRSEGVDEGLDLLLNNKGRRAGTGVHD